MPEYYTVKQTSIILGFSTNTIYKFLKSGRLKAIRGGGQQGRFRITRASIEKVLGVTLTPEYIQSVIHTSPQKETPAKHIETEVTAATTPPPTGLSLHLVRALIIIGLIFIILDLFLSRDFSLFQQILRLVLMAILILITYQFGGLYNQHDYQ